VGFFVARKVGHAVTNPLRPENTILPHRTPQTLIGYQEGLQSYLRATVYLIVDSFLSSLTEYARDHPQRNYSIVAAYRSGGYTLGDIGDFYGMHYSRV